MRTGIRSVGALLLGLGLLIGLASTAVAQTFPFASGIGYEPTNKIDLYYQRGQAITPIVFPEATGGSGVTYTLGVGTEFGHSILNLSDLGLSFDASTRTLSGTPTLSGGGSFGYQFSYTATGTSGSDTSQANITVCDDTAIPAGTTFCPNPADGDPVLSGISAQNYRAGTVITPLTLPAATGGTANNPRFEYELSGLSGLPDGLSFDTSTRVLSGTPTTVVTAALSYLARDVASGRTHIQMFTVTVVIGRLVLPDPADRNYTAGTPVSDVLPEVAGGGTLTYTLTGPSGGVLPTWLSFDATTRTLSGTPTVVAAATTLTYTVVRSEGSEKVTDTFTVTVALGTLVLPDPVDQIFMADTAISLVLGEAPYGASRTYTLTGPSSGDLPAGLNFDADTRTLSGTPTVVEKTELTYTVVRTDPSEPMMTDT